MRNRNILLDAASIGLIIILLAELMTVYTAVMNHENIIDCGEAVYEDGQCHDAPEVEQAKTETVEAMPAAVSVKTDGVAAPETEQATPAFPENIPFRIVPPIRGDECVVYNDDGSSCVIFFRADRLDDGYFFYPQ